MSSKIYFKDQAAGSRQCLAFSFDMAKLLSIDLSWSWERDEQCGYV